MFKKGFIVTTIFVISTFIQLISQIVVTRIFGASLALDTFLAAVAIPSIIVTIIFSTLNNVLVPVLGEKQANDPQDSYPKYFFSLLFTLGSLSLILSLVIAFFASPISHLLYPGRNLVFLDKVTQQMSFMFLSIPIAVVATILGAYYYVKKHFYRFPFAQLIGSITNLILIVGLFGFIGIWALVAGFILNLAFQILFVLPKHFSFKALKFINIKPVLIAWVPLVVGEFMLRSDTLIIRSYASFLPVGYFVYLNLISKIFALSTGILTIGIQVLLLPHLVEYFAKKQYVEAVRVINKSKIISIFVSITIAISILLLGPFAINLIFKGGKFTANDVQITSSLLPLFVLPAIGWGIGGVFFQPLLALKKYYSVGIISTISFVLALTTSYITNNTYGPLNAISIGLIVLLFTGIIGSEIIWQANKRKLLKALS